VSAPILRTRAPISRRLRAACAVFGLEVRPGPSPRGRTLAGAAARLDRALRAGDVALVTGPSGAGKSLLLRELGGRLRGRARPCLAVTSAPAMRSVLDEIAGLCGGTGPSSALRMLGRAGLSEARLLPRRTAELSEGQRHRYELARAMARAGAPGRRGVTLLVDEFASTLDRAAARGLAGTASRWARESGVRLVCATAHDDVLEWLAPRILVVVGMDGRVEQFER